jgi:hypothetical protein
MYEVNDPLVCPLEQVASAINFEEFDKGKINFSLEDDEEGVSRIVDLKKDKDGEFYFDLKVIVRR